MKKFSSHIVIPFADRFFDGRPEEFGLFEWACQRHPDCTFVEFAFDVKRLYNPFVRYLSGEEEWLTTWHSTSRYVGSHFVREEIDWLFFIDADEIVEGDRMAAWVRERLDLSVLAYWFQAYTYGWRAEDRKEPLQQCGLLVKKGVLSSYQYLNPRERFGFFHSVEGKKRREVVGIDGKPMIHHYSWVRSEAERVKKMETWSKKDQRDWKLWLVELQSVEGVRVDPYFDPLQVSLPTGLIPKRRWPRVDWKTMQKLEVEIALH